MSMTHGFMGRSRMRCGKPHNLGTEWVPHEVVKQDLARQRAELLTGIDEASGA